MKTVNDMLKTFIQCHNLQTETVFFANKHSWRVMSEVKWGEELTEHTTFSLSFSHLDKREGSERTHTHTHTHTHKDYKINTQSMCLRPLVQTWQGGFGGQQDASSQWHSISKLRRKYISCFGPMVQDRLFEPDLTQIVHQHSCTLAMAQSIRFELAVPNTAFYIPKGCTVSASQWEPIIWTEVKGQSSQGKVTQVAVEHINVPFALTFQLQLYCVGASTFRG